MVILLASLLVSPAEASPAFTVGPTGSVVGAHEIGLRPGVRLGFEPLPAAAIEVQGDSSFDARWDAGLSLAGRWWLSPALEPGEGLFLLGRFIAGFSGWHEEVGPWTGAQLGFGARPVPLLDVSASVGPEWAVAEGARWRTELALSFVFSERTTGGGPGEGSVRHKPRPIPK